MIWPFIKQKPVEDRADYTNAQIQMAIADAGKTTANAGQTSGLEIAAGVIARAFASCDISGPSGFKPPDAALMECVGRQLITDGDCLLARVGEDWMRATTWDVMGAAGEATWAYSCTFPAPNVQIIKKFFSKDVAHIRYSRDVDRPWVGVGPLERAKLAANFHANMELRTGQEAGAKVAHLLPIPTDGKDPTISGLKKDLSNAKGNIAFVETTSGGFGAGAIAKPQHDWKPNRMGATFANATNDIFRTAQLTVVAACGVPVELITSADGTGQREAWRRCLFGTILPLGRIVEAELSKVAGKPVEIGWDRLQASDVSGRARAYHSLVSAGMSHDEALAASGL